MARFWRTDRSGSHHYPELLEPTGMPTLEVRLVKPVPEGSDIQLGILFPSRSSDDVRVTPLQAISDTQSVALPLRQVKDMHVGCATIQHARNSSYVVQVGCQILYVWGNIICLREHICRVKTCVESSCMQRFFLSRNFGQVTPTIIYLHHLRNYFLDQSIQKIFYLILKKGSTGCMPNEQAQCGAPHRPFF